MKMSMNWLSALTEVKADPQTYIAAMTMSGSKVETLDYTGEEIQNVVAAKVLSMVPHENSDHLRVCSVDIGKEEPVQIVTGAKNVSTGDMIPLALDGAKLAGGTEIHTGKLRGVLSEGMMCGIEELGLTEHDVPGANADEVLLLNEHPDYADAEIGTDIRKVMGLDDYVVDFEITPNRPDCLSMIGLARETAATFGGKFVPETPVVEGGAGDIRDYLSVTVQDTELCPRYTARLVKNVRIAPSPKWMRDRLRSCGVRPINNIVDITNYVMLEYGQPMHAFDYACLEDSRIVVRRAKAGEKLETLDDQPRELNEKMLVIADGERAVAVGGVMGGANSEITANTRNVVFESANFMGASVRLTARALGMRTEASGRFEKGLDSRLTLPALERACQLVELLGAGDVCDGIIDVDNANYRPRILKLEAARINNFIGINIPEEQMVKYLTLLGFEVNGTEIKVPSWRTDVEQFADIAEEVARLYGYDKIPTTLYAGATTYHVDPVLEFEEKLKDVCAAIGYDEAATYSFINQKSYDKLGIAEDSILRKTLVLLNPLSEEMRVMRTTCIPSMLECLARNANAKNEKARLFEVMKLYFPVLKDGVPDVTVLPEEKRLLCLGGYGNMDFFTLKAAVEAIGSHLRLGNLRYEAETGNVCYHPGRCAKVFAADTCIGVLGQIHPTVAERFDMDSEAYIAEIDFDALMKVLPGIVQFKLLPKFPAVNRDLAVVCDDHVTAGALEDCIRRGVGELLENIRLFDVFRGAQIGDDKKSVAFTITMRDNSRTLETSDADDAMARAIEELGKIGAYIRA